jgi:hypothetical protein
MRNFFKLVLTKKGKKKKKKKKKATCWLLLVLMLDFDDEHSLCHPHLDFYPDDTTWRVYDRPF